MYAPIDPEHRHMEDVLRSLGAVLDAHLARAVAIRQRGDRLTVHAQVTASISARLEGSWSPLEQTLTHVDIAQAQMAAAARRGAGHIAGPLERSLGAIGRIVDAHGLQDLTLIQHTSNDAWLVWHAGTGSGQATLMTLTVDELLAADAAAAVADERRIRSGLEPRQGPGPAHDRTWTQWGRRSDGRAPRPQLGQVARETIAVRPGRSRLAHAGAVPDM